MTPRSALAVLMVASVVAAAAGCGKEEKGELQKTEAIPKTEQVSALIKEREYRIIPGHLALKRGEKIEVSNVGGVNHNLTIEEGPNPKKKSEEVEATDDINPGDDRNLTLTVKPGRYAMVCTIPGHRALGMTGNLTVR